MSPPPARYTRHPLMLGAVRPDRITLVAGEDRVVISAFVVYPDPEDDAQEENFGFLHECCAVLVLDAKQANYLVDRIPSMLEKTGKKEDEGEDK